MLRPQPKNVTTFVTTFRAESLGKTGFVTTLRPPGGIGIPLVPLLTLSRNLNRIPFEGIRTYPKLIGPNRSYPEFQPAPLAITGDHLPTRLRPPPIT